MKKAIKISTLAFLAGTTAHVALAAVSPDDIAIGNAKATTGPAADRFAQATTTESVPGGGGRDGLSDEQDSGDEGGNYGGDDGSDGDEGGDDGSDGDEGGDDGSGGGDEGGDDGSGGDEGGDD